MLTDSIIDRAVRAALDEDCPWGDVTVETTIPADATGVARLVPRQPGVLSGGRVFVAAFRLQDPRLEVSLERPDGSAFEPGDVLATVRGPVRGILTAGRVALNFTQHMSGIATMTRAFVDAATAACAPGAAPRIVDTRKTLPGLRAFEKYAVTCGGGHNHRFGLSDAVMVKDNHLAALREAGLDTVAALRAIRGRIGHTTTIEVEVDSPEQIPLALDGGADIIMLDNFSLDDTRRGVELIAHRAVVEASGTMTLDRIPGVAATGVDVISVGALTHSVKAVDLGLDWE
ncbi:carboxylating nicotinate-nucleotide diphosphorylase [Pseudoscardovia radai]|uniref:carboxylating nicotinate-nucleotide diphosphorylase n=1 Tax=Pseudoscardovia radai TaxID=987066 RepID=UPI0039929D98